MEPVKKASEAQIFAVTTKIIFSLLAVSMIAPLLISLPAILDPRFYSQQDPATICFIAVPLFLLVYVVAAAGVVASRRWGRRLALIWPAAAVLLWAGCRFGISTASTDSSLVELLLGLQGFVIGTAIAAGYLMLPPVRRTFDR